MGRDEGGKQKGQKKGNISKVNDIQGILTLGHLNWTICIMQLFKKKSTFSPSLP